MSELKWQEIEKSGQGGFEAYRIPGIVVTAKGTIITYYETRLGASDWSTRGVGVRRSEDGGITFLERQMVVYDEKVAINNPVMIASRDGSVHLLWQKDYRELFYQVSKDDGATFSEPASILEAVEAFKSEYDWSLFAVGPGHGIELQNGRLVVPIWLARGEGDNHFPTQVSTIISDDGGQTWVCGEVIYGSERTEDDFAWPNETQAVELTDGRVLLNIRHNGKLHYRYKSVSVNGKDQFSTPVPDMNLPDPICFGSVLRAKEDILFVNCAHNDACGWAPRINLTVRLSEDDAKTWKYAKQIAEVSAYADIACSPDGSTYYCFLEHEKVAEGGYPRELVLAVFDKIYLMQ
ncbi:MAG: sialidase family protein [Cellulosilyticaceae bacterium]